MFIVNILLFIIFIFILIYITKTISADFEIVIIAIICCCFALYAILQSNRIDKERERFNSRVEIASKNYSTFEEKKDEYKYENKNEQHKVSSEVVKTQFNKDEVLVQKIIIKNQDKLILKNELGEYRLEMGNIFLDFVIYEDIEEGTRIVNFLTSPTNFLKNYEKLSSLNYIEVEEEEIENGYYKPFKDKYLK